MSRMKKSGSKKKTENKKKNADAVRTGRFDQTSVQASIPIKEWYENGIFRLNDRSANGSSTYAVICSCTNAGYLSKTESEKTRKYHAYQEALAALPVYLHYEEIVANRPVNRQTYLDAIASGAETDDKYKNSFFDVQKMLVEKIDREISLKRHLLALSIEVKENESPYNKLFDAVTMLDGKFREMGSSLTVLSPDEVLAELYCWYHPFGGTIPKLPPDLYRRGLTVRDIIAPDGIEYKKSSLELGSAHCRIFTITDYGREISDNIIYTLLNNDLPISISKHIDHVGKEAALKTIKKQLDELESRRQSRLQRNHSNGTNFVPMELERSIQGCNQILEGLAGNEEFLLQTVYVTVYAHSEEQLDEYCDRVCTTALSLHCTLKAARHLQEDAFKSVLPLGKHYLPIHQIMMSSEAAVMTPFSYESCFDPNGFWYGRNEHSGEPIIFNRKLDKSSNGFVLGISGSGKGVWVKNEITNILFQPSTANDEIIIVDASGEYIPLANAVNGKVIELTPSSKTHLNPLYISDTQMRLVGREKAVASKIAHLIALLSQIKAGGGLTAVEKSLVDSVAGRCLKKPKGATLDRFYNELEKELDEQPVLRPVIEEMRSWLKRYVEGSVKLFSGEDAEEKMGGNRLIVYSVRDLTGDLRDAGMLAMLERIESRVMENFAVGRWTWIYIEEAHRYFNAERNPYAAARFSRFYSELRKFGGILTAITQLPRPVKESLDGATMLSNSKFVVMAELDGDNIDAVAEQYSLNEDQQRTLASAEIGQYIVRMNNAPTSVRMVYPGRRPGEENLMYELFNTSFEEAVASREGFAALGAAQSSETYVGG